jgi:hypothetical protein
MQCIYDFLLTTVHIFSNERNQCQYSTVSMVCANEIYKDPLFYIDVGYEHSTLRLKFGVGTRIA